ncbi:hypothetical protein HHK36_024928 [Tetracentron sinense]|uniref:Protein farnesyltransferase subunit beta n=1 Tax=Tetracentron sinense TaxID=13715 RepID=A0A834YL54_TETSI|nr:hypothetical protein HHK36_024928 [Tetracentron sinense]
MDSASSKPTVTQRDQWMVEGKVFEIYKLFGNVPRHAQTLMLELQRDKHMEYLTKGLRQLGPGFCVLDANRTWLCYWILHSIALLGESVEDELENNAIDFLSHCQDPNGGYGGGPGQASTRPTMPHLATTYAAVNSLITLGGLRALSSINRDKLYIFLLRMKDPSGGFRCTRSVSIVPPAYYAHLVAFPVCFYMEPETSDSGSVTSGAAGRGMATGSGGARSTRVAAAAVPVRPLPALKDNVKKVASILKILDYELVRNVGNYILSCQTYEGGISGEPGSEAHGGYTFCGLATMILINETDRLDLTRLIDWVAFRQGGECGFQGRANKLVDGCYSFWQGAIFPLIQRLHSIVDEQLRAMNGGEGKHSVDRAHTVATSKLSEGELSLDETSSQVDEACHCRHEGKLSDIAFNFLNGCAELEPLFHSIALQQYILLCSQVQDGGFKDKPGKYRDYYHTCYCLSGLAVCQYCCSKDANSPPSPRAVFGPYSNLLEPIHPLFNVVLDRYHEAHEFFSS